MQIFLHFLNLIRHLKEQGWQRKWRIFDMFKSWFYSEGYSLLCNGVTLISSTKVNVGKVSNVTLPSGIKITKFSRLEIIVSQPYLKMFTTLEQLTIIGKRTIFLPWVTKSGTGNCCCCCCCQLKQCSQCYTEATNNIRHPNICLLKRRYFIA